MELQEFQADVAQLNQVLAYAEQQLDTVSTNIPLIMNMSIIIEELFVNVAKYAYQGGTGSAWIGIEVDEERKCVVMELEDEGVAYDPLAKDDPDITLSAEEREIGGLGILMVKEMSDRMSYEYRDGRNCLLLEKKFE